MGKDACVCVCVHICIRSIPPVSPEIKQRLSPLQCTKSSCGSDTWIKQATSMSSPKSFSEPLHLSGFWEASRGETHVTKRHPSFSHLTKGIGFRFPCKTHQQTTKLLLSLFFPPSSSVAWDTFPWGSSSACKKPIISSDAQTLEKMGCAITGLLFKEASVLSIWQLFIIAVALRNNNSHDNCFSYIKMLQSLFPTTFCLSGMCVPMSPQS